MARHGIPTYNEVMTQKPIFISEADGYLYVELTGKEYYDNSVWKISKQTHEVSYISFVDYLAFVADHATYVVKPDWEK